MDINKVLDKLGISELNKMQQEAMNVILRKNDDVVILSPTGSGKTLAYLLPLIQKIDSQLPHVQMLVVVPGRELALQSQRVLKDMGTGLRSMALYGGRATMDEHRKMREVQPQVVFATPGRFNDHLLKENVSPLFIKYVVIDEFDKCLEMGFREEMSLLMGRLRHAEQTILLSATDAEEIPRFVRMGHTQRLDYLVKEEQVSERVLLYKVNSPTKDKLETLKQLLLDFGDESTVVFLNYRDSVERTAAFLRECGFSISMFHGGLEQKQREDALYRFSNGSANVLVCTDLASRGLDIPDIQNIVHYHLPLGEDGYIHRVGRTARWDKSGKTFFVLNQEEQIPDYIEGNVKDFIPSPLNDHPQLPKMATLYIGKGKKDKISKGDVVGFLCKIGGLKSDEIGRIDVNDRYSYVAVKQKRLASVLRNVQGEKIKGLKTIFEEIK
jgi:superfamily II DNA/RNA helicase